ncbi:MAG: hypothetical protein Q9162_003216 [Coniocarpon cinnabarinum]
MDAKPLRLTRSKTIRDENQPIDLLPTKRIHQRNKSSPALTTLSQAAPIKTGPTKRAAFADVTNAQRRPSTTVDAHTNKPKPQFEVVTNKDLQSDGIGAPLQRPAHRPISVSSIRGFFNALGGTGRPNDVAETRKSSDMVHPAPKLVRKSTKVFREHPEHTSPHGALEEPRQGNDKNPYNLQDEQKPTRVDCMNAEDQRSNKADTDLLNEQVTRVADLDKKRAITEHEPEQDISYLAHSHLVRPSEELPHPYYSERQSAGPTLLPVAATQEHLQREPYVESEGDYTTARSLKLKGDCTNHQTTVIVGPQFSEAAEQEIAEASLFVQSSVEAIELEEDESWDTSMVTEYSEEIFAYMRNMEEQMRPNPHYMDNQTEVQWSMRSVLMDWLVQVHHRFSLLPETLFLCVNYIDRFLSCKVVSLGKLQLVGATAIFVAAKYEEINCPSVQEIVYMVDGGYSADEILKAERFMLSMLGFELGFPGPMSFLRRISKADDYDLETRTLAKYFMEITIMDERFVGCIPSYTAAGAHCLSRLMLDKGLWTKKHVHYSGYTYAQLRPLLLTMLSCCDDPRRHHAAIFDKYADKKFKRASTFVQGELDRGFLLPAVPARSSIAYESSTEDSQRYLFS